MENRNIINESIKFGQYETMIVAAALVFTNADRKADIEKIKECREILKKKTGALSGYRGTIETVLVSKMALQEDPEKYLEEVIRINQLVNRSKIEYAEAIIAAMNVVDMGRSGDAEEITCLMIIMWSSTMF